VSQANELCEQIATHAFNRGQLQAKANELILACSSEVGALLKIESIADVIGKLKRERLFEEVVRLVQSLPSAIELSLRSRRDFCQCLIEIQNFWSAKRELQSLLQDSQAKGDTAMASEARGLLGRLGKQQYIGEGVYLQDAWNAYSLAFEEDPYNYWHAINLVALGHFAKRRGVTLSNVPNLMQLAKDTLELVESKNEGTVWAIATKAEAYLALEDFPKAVTEYKQYIEKADSVFELGSTLRQLIEVWNLDENSESGIQIIPRFKSRMLELSGARITVTKADLKVVNQLVTRNRQAIHGGEPPIPIERYRKAIDRSQIVVMLRSQTGAEVGTGFLIPKKFVYGDSNEFVLVTNFHVAQRVNALVDVGEQINLQGKLELLDQEVALGVVLWFSPECELDVCVTSIQPVEQAIPLPTCYTGPITANVDRAYVIGHPKGRGVEISIADNQIVKVMGDLFRYRTPTEDGSSGSPVFLSDWRLVGVHRAAVQANSLDQAANEGVLFSAIQEAASSNPMNL
jgi:tetratricopeptide (TPR) repeat protein